MPIPAAFPHQEVTSRFVLERDASLITSDPGTGKTRCVLDAFSDWKTRYPHSRLIVLCPKSIMHLAWEVDAGKFTPHLSVSLATANKREEAYRQPSDIVVMNHEGVLSVKDWVHEYIPPNSWLVIDEFTWFKNPRAKRSTACLSFAQYFQKRIGMSGTPYSSSALDIFMPMKIIDDGLTLGNNYYRFRNMVCTMRMKGMFKEWVDKPDAIDIVTMLLHDVAIRYSIRDVIDIPEFQIINRPVAVTPAVEQAYTQLREEAVLLLASDTITSVNAGVLKQKMLQCLSGFVYNNSGEGITIDRVRSEIIMEEAALHDSAIIAYQWRKQKDILAAIAEYMDLRFAVIDADTPFERRNALVHAFQMNEIDYLLAHPRTLGHGITLTRSATVIWAAPTPSTELFHQMNARVYRNGQQRECQIIRFYAEHTPELRVYERVDAGLEANEQLLAILAEQTRTRD